ncbi:protein FAM8A1-like isoform X2 [Drosophila kikkawai]|uniref:Protein FAM8A1-like isoform X2 n=1 Tax=Drosophila kikkawai TaxID=30033 RepID=A0A6P4IWC0_DROKI|nr:protein FAM8A1-like isoform X2 [Drosophila kikkawai]
MSKEQNLCAKEAYFASLDEWAKQAHQAQEAMLGFPAYLLAKYPQLFRTPNGGQPRDTFGLYQPRPIQAAAQAGALGILPGQNNRPDHRRLRHRRSGYLVTLAPLWKRAVAQAIDIYLLIFLKVLIARLLVSQFPGIGKELTLLARTLLKLAGLCYEPLWTSCCNGTTPGKWLMGIRIVTAGAVVQFRRNGGLNYRQAQNVLAYPAGRLNIRRAIFRSLVKLFVVTIILPITNALIFNRYGATYDQWTKTIVVEAKSDFRFIQIRNRR